MLKLYYHVSSDLYTMFSTWAFPEMEVRYPLKPIYRRDFPHFEKHRTVLGCPHFWNPPSTSQWLPMFHDVSPSYHHVPLIVDDFRDVHLYIYNVSWCILIQFLGLVPINHHRVKWCLSSVTVFKDSAFTAAGPDRSWAELPTECVDDDSVSYHVMLK